jgi:type VI secretion system protein ImpC
MSAAWAYAVRVADAHARHGWTAAVRGVENGGKVEGLPVRTALADDGASVAECPAEIALADRHVYELSNLGFLPLVRARGSGVAVFMGAQSCHQPRVYDDPAETASAETAAQVNLLLCASRFLHYLKVMARDTVGRFGVEDCTTWLNRWIRDYVFRSPEDAGPDIRARKPLYAAWIEVEAVPGCPGRYQIKAHLRPGHQLPDLRSGMSLTTEAPLDAAFRPAAIERAWLRWNDGRAAALAWNISRHGRFSDLPILADVLEAAGCSEQRILGHCREEAGGHNVGCWVLDALLAEEQPAPEAPQR